MNGIAIIGIIILCIVFPPLGFALLLVVGLGMLCFAGTKTVEAATPKDSEITPAQREYNAASLFGWIVFVIVAAIYVVHIATTK